MNIEDHKKYIQEFAEKHGLEFDVEGEVGFGRECVGLRKGNNYVDYNPYHHSDYSRIRQYESEVLDEIAPADAYHKHDCIAVLGHGDKAIIQLSQWCRSLEEHGAKVVEYSTGAMGMQALFSGSTGHCFVINNPK